MDKFECEICHEKFESITASHLKKHGMTRLEYIKLYRANGVQGSPNSTPFKRPPVSDADNYWLDRLIRINASEHGNKAKYYNR